MSQAILVFTILFSPAAVSDFPSISGEAPDKTDRWTTSGGRTSIRFDPGLLKELEISVHAPVRPPASEMPGEFEFDIRETAGLEFWAPWAAFDGFAAGELAHEGHLTLEWPGGRLEVEGFSLRPAAPDALELVDGQGNSLFRLDYIHTMLYPDARRMTLWNMDVSLSPWLAERMGYEDLDGIVIASAFTSASLTLPEGAYRGAAVCGPPNWDDGGDFYTDVELTGLGIVQQVAREADIRVAIAPSATLQNVGTADVPWYEKFDTEPGSDYPDPYDRDQHPFLVWAMYRIVDDIPQQIGQSAVKHAFFAQNGSCDCAGGHILWSAGNTGNNQGCTDTYGVGTNDNEAHLGIRANLPAFTGAFEQCGSIFAPDEEPPGPCTQTDFGDDGDDPGFERRLVVAESDLSTPDATYYFEGWYVVRDDVNIFNTMAHVSVDPTPPGVMWTFPSDPTQEGPAINTWVPPNTRGGMQAHTVEATSAGHYSLAVKVTDLGAGNFRYVYALMNYDFDPKFNSFSLAVPEGVTLTNIDFLDGDSDSDNDWAAGTAGGRLTFTAPEGAALEWGFMATFVFEADQAPVEGAVRLTGDEAPLIFHPLILGLSDEVYSSGFEE